MVIAEPMPYQDPHTHEKQADCLKLYLKYGGRDHDKLEAEMRQLGWANFSRRILYSRNQRGTHVSGWIEKLGWHAKLIEHFDKTTGGIPVLVRSTIERAAKRAKFHEWIKTVSPPNFDWDTRYHKYICEQLERVDSGECKRLMIFVPPRHGKSELVTVRYTAWTLKNDPAKNVVIASYGQKLANRFSRKVRRALSDDWALTTAETRSRGDEKVEQVRANAAQLNTAKRLEPQGNPQCFSPRLRDSTVKNNEDECPFSFVTTRQKNTEAEWETSKGGGLRAVGVGGGITGFGADLIIIDDPVKSRAEAESINQREAVWNWFNDDIYTRLEPEGKMILIQTRWHEDDLAGRLLRQMNEGEGEHWDVVNLPAIAVGRSAAESAEAVGQNRAELKTVKKTGLPPHSGQACSEVEDKPLVAKPRVIGFPRLYSHVHASKNSRTYAGSTGTPFVPDRGVALPTRPSRTDRPHAAGTGVGKQDGCAPVEAPTDQLSRQPGESLWPERFPVKKLEITQKQLGTYSFSALYQQNPVPAEGGMFKRAWFDRIISAPPPGLRWIRGYDLAASAGTNADYTASFRVAFDRDENMYIDGGFRRRMEYPEMRRFLLQRIASESNTEHCIEASLNAKPILQDIKTEPVVRRRSLREIAVKEAKTARALSWVNLAEQGRVFLVRGAWNDEFIDECCSFPLGTHDDQVDAVSLAVKARRSTDKRLHRFK